MVAKLTGIPDLHSVLVTLQEEHLGNNFNLLETVFLRLT